MNERTILDRILDEENLFNAYKNVKRNGGSAGVDGMEVGDLFNYLRENHSQLIEQIRNRTYKPQPVLRVEIPKDNGGVRLLGIPTALDRIIQQAINQVLTPIFDSQFHKDSYGFRPRKSARQAITRALEIFNEGYSWIVDIDLERFFDTVHHDRLMNLIYRIVKDGDVISLIRKYLVSGVQIDGKVLPTPVGTPQGGNLSPLLSNIMLNELDKELENRGLKFVRYADDCIIMVRSEMSAKRVMRNVCEFIEKKLGLIVNASKSQIVKPNSPDLKFLGFGFYYSTKEKKYRAKPHEKSVSKFKRALHNLSRKSWGVSMEYRIQRINWVVRGWVNYFGIGDMKRKLIEISSHLRYRLRMCIWKQWKNGKTRVKSLIKLGMSKYEARKNGHSSKGCARIALSWVMTTTVTNARLKQKGLVSPLDYYLNHA
jgi:group II intron reverse transcriptase/maturase